MKKKKNTNMEKNEMKKNENFEKDSFLSSVSMVTLMVAHMYIPRWFYNVPTTDKFQERSLSLE